MKKLIVGSLNFCYENEYGNDMSQFDGFKKAWELKEDELKVWKEKAISKNNLIAEIENIINDNNFNHYSVSDKDRMERIKSLF